MKFTGDIYVGGGLRVVVSDKGGGFSVCRDWEDTSTFTHAKTLMHGIIGRSFEAFCWVDMHKNPQNRKVMLKH